MQLAHISDLHVKAPLGPWTGLLNKRWIGAVTLLRRAHPDEILDGCIDDLAKAPPDHLAVTGDLSNIALVGEWLAARNWIEETGLPCKAVTVKPPLTLSMNVAGRVGYVSPTPSAPCCALRLESGVAVMLMVSPLRSKTISTGLSKFARMISIAG